MGTLPNPEPAPPDPKDMVQRNERGGGGLVVGNGPRFWLDHPGYFLRLLAASAGSVLAGESGLWSVGYGDVWIGASAGSWAAAAFAEWRVASGRVARAVGESVISASL